MKCGERVMNRLERKQEVGNQKLYNRVSEQYIRSLQYFPKSATR